MITSGDKKFLTDVAMTRFGVKELRIKHSSSKKKWPDIWLSFNGVPTITITDEWRSHDKHLRRSQLVHEFLHISGMEHDEKIGYSTFPDKDTFSKRVYRHLLGVGGKK